MPIVKGYLTAGRSSSSDECMTPAYAVLPIIKYLNAKNYHTIWCPFDEKDSAFVKVLSDNGFNVIYSHINNGQDFFTYTPSQSYDCIVSNPPFSSKDKVLERLYKLEKPFMILLPQNSLQSKSRTPMFIKNGLEYLGFDKRICYYVNGILNTSNCFASGYFCHNVLPEKMILEILNIF